MLGRLLKKHGILAGKFTLTAFGHALGPILCLALASYSPLDPTPFVYSTWPTQNWLGHSGALLADGFIQIFGHASWLIAISLSWFSIAKLGGIKTPKNVPKGLAILTATCLFAYLFHHQTAHTGGIAGASIAKWIPYAAHWGARLFSAVLGAFLLGYALGISAHLVKSALWNMWLFLAFVWAWFCYLCRLGAHGAQTLFAWVYKSLKKEPQETRYNPAYGNTASKPAFLNTGSSAKPGLTSAQPTMPTTAQAKVPAYTPPKAPSFKELKAKNAPVSIVPKAPPKSDDAAHLLSLDLLTAESQTAAPPTTAELQSLTEDLLRVLQEFGIEGRILTANPGPVVTLYEFEPAPGIKSSRVISLADDIARSMGALSSRISVVPGRNAMGIELPNPGRETVFLRSLLQDGTFCQTKAALPLALGKNIAGTPIVADLARMPHLLVAGTTGSGKSVGVNAMILSLLFRLPPDACQMIMVDPKMLELSVYDGIPHLIAPVITEPKKAVLALKWAVQEMERRYRLLSSLGVRNIDGYNRKINAASKSGDTLTRRIQTGFDDEGKPILEEQPIPEKPMPYIVVVVDEMADLMLVAGKEIEGAIQRLAQMARAAGIHLIMATQRPSVDVLTGTIKANFPSRISFQVTSKIDSRTILGEQGAEQLLGQGDMLYMPVGKRPTRIHGPFVSDQDVERVVNALKDLYPDYEPSISFDPDDLDSPFPEAGGGDGEDELYQQALQIILRDKKISTSYIQRRLQIGYNRAARLMDMLEERGVVSPAGSTGKRTLLKGA